MWVSWASRLAAICRRSSLHSRLTRCAPTSQYCSIPSSLWTSACRTSGRASTSWARRGIRIRSLSICTLHRMPCAATSRLLPASSAPATTAWCLWLPTACSTTRPCVMPATSAPCISTPRAITVSVSVLGSSTTTRCSTTWVAGSSLFQLLSRMLCAWLVSATASPMATASTCVPSTAIPLSCRVCWAMATGLRTSV